MISRSAVLVWMLLLLTSGAAWAQQTGVQFYENGDYEAAVQQLTQELSDPQHSEAERAQAHVYLAATLHAMGQAEAARKQLDLLAREHTEQRVDPVRFPPELVALAEAIRQQVVSEQEFAAREAQLRREREEALRRAPPTPPLYLRPEALGLFEAVDRALTVGAGVGLRRESLEGSFRVLLGNPPAFHLQAGLLPSTGKVSLLLGLRASLIPGLDSYGVGPVVGGRLALPKGWVGMVDVGGDYFFVSRDDRYHFAVTAQAGIGFDVRLH